MIAIQQTIDVPERKHYNPPLGLEEAKAVIAEKIRRRENGEAREDSSRKYAGCLEGKNIFTGCTLFFGVNF
jgi:aspartate/methionine/tyrosine aminotransferase